MELLLNLDPPTNYSAAEHQTTLKVMDRLLASVHAQERPLDEETQAVLRDIQSYYVSYKRDVECIAHFDKQAEVVKQKLLSSRRNRSKGQRSLPNAISIYAQRRAAVQRLRDRVNRVRTEKVLVGMREIVGTLRVTQASSAA